MEQIALSPDGENLAFLSVLGEKRYIVITSFKDLKTTPILDATTAKIRDLAWADSKHLLITQSRTTNIFELRNSFGEHFFTLVYDVESKKLTNLLQQAAKALNTVSEIPQARTVNGRTVVFAEGTYFPDNIGYHALFAVDVATGRVKLQEGKSKSALDWVIDAQGDVVAESSYEEEKQRWSLRLKKDGKWVDVYEETSPIDWPSVEGLSPDGKSIIVSDVSEKGGAEWRAMSLAAGKWDEATDLSYMVSNVIKDPATHLIIGGQRGRTKTQYFFFNPKDEMAWESIALSFDGENVELMSWSNDRTKVLVKVEGPKTGVGYHVVDLNSHRITPVGNAYEGIAAADYAPVHAIVYDAADGTKIPAFLTLPHGRDPKKLPLIVLVHGGPASRDMPGFDWWSQGLASRGYAVLQPQFRGSTGISDAHRSAGFGEWGRKMQSDVSDGVRDLAKDGLIDPARVCIVGASYGGYAALAGVTLESGVYRCAVSVSGVTDPRGMLPWTRSRQWRSTSAALRYWDRFMGVRGVDDPKLAEISPLTHAAEASAPILLLHGEKDTVVDPGQSDDMNRALKKANKAVTFISLKGEDHWLSRSETRLQMLQESVKFLETNNPPK